MIQQTHRGTERKQKMNRLKILVAVALSGLVFILTGCGSSGDPLSSDTSKGSSSPGTLTIGSADFPESALLAEIYAGALQAKGVKVAKKLNIGSREAYIPALKDGSIDLIPEYTGVLLQYFNQKATESESEAVYKALQAALPTTLSVLEKSPAEDKDVVTVTKATADKYSLKSIADLKAVSSKLTLGGPPEWKTRYQGVPGLEKVYGVKFGSFRPLDAGGPLTVQALKNGQIHAADLFSTDPSIEQNNFVVLDDPKSLFPAENVVPLITKSKGTETITKTLNAVSAALNTTTLAELLKEVVIDKKDASAVAASFLSKNKLN